MPARCRLLTAALLLLSLFSAGPAQTTLQKNGNGITSLATRPLSPAQARERIRMMHDVYETTLLAMHRHYFVSGKEKVIPSRAMEDVFYRMNKRWGIKARWLAVSAQAMNIDHKPRDAFEKAAVRALAMGKPSHEETRQGTYRRAGPIVLFANCIRCHTSRRRKPVAGLILSVPIKMTD